MRFEGAELKYTDFVDLEFLSLVDKLGGYFVSIT